MSDKTATIDLTGQFVKSLVAENQFLREALEAIANGEWVTDSSAQEIAKQALAQQKQWGT